MVRILFLADIVGRPGRRIVQQWLPDLRQEFNPDLVIANGENSAGGLGIDFGTAKEIFGAGADVITTGNHVWNKKEVTSLLAAEGHRLIRPLNFSAGAPGLGHCTWTTKSGVPILIANVMGRVFMTDLLDCPFATTDALLSEHREAYPVVFIDFHAEATSEKVAFGHFVDGRASVVVGTHTHVQTADERILPNGTAYITDVGMCGPYHSVIGVEVEAVVQRFVTGRPMRFEVAEGPAMLNGIIADCDESTGSCIRIERICRYSKP